MTIVSFEGITTLLFFPRPLNGIQRGYSNECSLSGRLTWLAKITRAEKRSNCLPKTSNSRGQNNQPWWIGLCGSQLFSAFAYCAFLLRARKVSALVLGLCRTKKRRKNIFLSFLDWVTYGWLNSLSFCTGFWDWHTGISWLREGDESYFTESQRISFPTGQKVLCLRQLKSERKM